MRSNSSTSISFKDGRTAKYSVLTFRHCKQSQQLSVVVEQDAACQATRHPARMIERSDQASWTYLLLDLSHAF